MKNKSLIEKIGKGIVKKGLGLAIAGSDTQYGREFNFQNYGFCGIEDASTIHDVNMDGLRKLNGFDANYNDNISVIRSIENSKIERIDANVEQEKLDEANKIYNKFLDKLLGDLGL
ncbi:hypothetical protein J4481_01815 [Candidatus Pacearchaeota archaeon]|nr:hypothetical protein [Candidatus Pacearchaeota archaeon]